MSTLCFEMNFLQSEIIAAKEGMLLAWELGIRSIVLEGHAKNVIECFESSEEDLSDNGVILADAFNIASWFSYFSPHFVPTLHHV